MSLREAHVELIDCDHRTPPPATSGYAYVTIPDLRDGRIDVSGARRITPDHYHEWTRRAKPQPNDVVLSRRTNPGVTAFVPSGLDFALGQNLVLLRSDGSVVDPEFLRWLVRAPDWWEQIQRHLNVGAVFDSLKCADIPNFRLSIPPLMEQRRIAEFLAAMDDKIELNRRMTQTLELMARALFKSWFVDFDPVRAKAEDLDPALPSQIADLFPASFEDSDIGPIPIGWGASTLGEMVEINPSRTLRSGDFAPYLDMANAPMTGHSPDSVVDRIFRSGSRFINGDTLVARITPCLENGKASFVDFLPEGEVGWGSTEFLVLRPRSPLPPELAYCLARSDPFREYATQNMSGTSGRQRVSADAISRYPLVRPTESVAAAFGSAAAQLLGRAKLANAESNTLSAQRDSLLPRLISGKRAGAA